MDTTNTVRNPDLCMDWDAVLESDGQEFITLPEGDYNFAVTNFERGRFPGSEKIPVCNKATITCVVTTDAGRATVRFDLIMYRTLEWRISGFFRCIGLKKHGEKLSMDWNSVVGSMGRAHFKPRKYTNSRGEEKTANDIDRFYDYDPAFFKETVQFEEVADENLPFD